MSMTTTLFRWTQVNWIIQIGSIIYLSFVPVFSADATVTVNSQKTLQTIDGWGHYHQWEGWRGSMQRASYFNVSYSCTITEAPWNFMHLAVNFNWWEPTNDNADPVTFNWTGFNNVQKAPDYFANMKSHGISTTIMEVGATPAWWSSASDDEKAESIAAMLIKTLNDKNVMVTYLMYTSATSSLIKKASQRFEQMGLTTKWIVGGMYESSVAAYVKPLLEDTSISRFLAPFIAYSCTENPSTSSLSAIAAIAEQHGKRAWNTHSSIMSNYDADNDPGGDYYTIGLWPYGWLVINNYYKNLKYGHASCNLWSDFGLPLLGSWYCNKERSFAYYVFHQMATLFIAGSNVVDATSNNQSIWSLAAKKGTNFGLMIINANTVSKTVDINSLPNGTYSVVLTDTTHKMAVLGNQMVSNGNLSLTLLPKSLVTISTNAATPVLNQLKNGVNKGKLLTIKNASSRTIGLAAEHETLNNVSVYNIAGSLVLSTNNTGKSDILFEKYKLVPGVYFARAKIENHVETISFVY